MSFGVAPRGERSGLLMQEFGAFAVTYSPVVEIYWYFTGIYHIFDYFGKWYGKRKSGMVNWFDCLIVWASHGTQVAGRPSLLGDVSAGMISEITQLGCFSPIPLIHHPNPTLQPCSSWHSFPFHA